MKRLNAFLDRFWFYALIAGVVLVESGYIFDPYYHHWKCWTVYVWPFGALLFGQNSRAWRKLLQDWEGIAARWQMVAESANATAQLAVNTMNLMAKEDDSE